MLLQIALIIVAAIIGCSALLGIIAASETLFEPVTALGVLLEWTVAILGGISVGIVAYHLVYAAVI